MTDQEQDRCAGGTARRPDRRKTTDLLACALLTVVTVVLWAGRRHDGADQMEEGFILVLPLRVWHGAVQNKSFDYFYGPASLWLPAVLYQVTSPSLLVERGLGAAYVIALGASLYFIGRRWHPITGLLMGLLSISVIGRPIGLPLNGAVAASVAAILVATGDEHRHRREVGAGLLLALAGDLRPDFVLWSIILIVALIVLGQGRLRLIIGFLAGLVPYVVLVCLAGIGPVWRGLVVASLHVGAERRLPLPGLLSSQGRALILVAAALIVALAIGIGRARRRPEDRKPRTIIALTVLGVVLLPEYAQRADVYHLAVPAAVILPLLVLCASEVAGAAKTRHSRKATEARRRPLIGLVAIGLIVAVSPRFTLVDTLHDVADLSSGGSGHPVANEGRRFYYRSAADAAAVQAITERADQLFRPGDRLFVGTKDLRQTPYVDDGIYFLLPQYVDRSHFYDFHPRLALDQSRQLANDVSRADVLVLWNIVIREQSNLSSRFGPDTANLVVARDFRMVQTAGDYSLYVRR